MLQIALDISKVAFGTAFATFIAITIIRPKTKAGWAFSLLFGVILTLASMKFYSEYGESPEDKLACVIFSSGSACTKNGKSDSNKLASVKPSPAVKPAPPKTSATTGSKEADTLPSEDISAKVAALPTIPTDGWWPERTPIPTDAIRGSPDRLWLWATQNAGSCEPLRHFVKIYPQDSRATQARQILVNRQVKTKPHVRIYSDGAGPLTYTYEVYDKSKSEAQACSVLRQSVVDGKPISIEGSLKRGWADCSGRIDGANAAGAKRRLLGYQDIPRSKCGCTSTFLDGLILGLRTCSMEFERICKIEELSQIIHEKCT